MPARLLVLGLDAVDPRLVGRWTADGTLPGLAGLIDSGVSGRVRGVDGFFVGSTWPSLSTGLGPAGHGFHRIAQVEPGTYRFHRPLDRVDGVAGVPFWRRASDAGLRVAVLDVPLTRLESDLNGLHVVEWGGHDVVFGFRAAPPSVGDGILASAGPYPLPANCDADRTTAGDFERFVAGLEQAIAVKTRLTLDVLAGEDWDLVVQVFTEGHCAGHQCWHLHDPTHPSFDRDVAATVGDPLERVYRALDEAVATIVERGLVEHVLVFSAHGMGAYRGADFLLPEILFRLGATARPDVALRVPGGGRTGIAHAARAAWSGLPLGVRERLRPVRARVATTRSGAASGDVAAWADVRGSRCFAVPNGGPVSAIRLNLKGREPHGVITPGEEEAFCCELASELLELVDDRTGGRLVASVERTETITDGPRRNALPDILVTWNDAPVGSTAHAGGRGALVRARSGSVGVVEGRNRFGRTGEHVPSGMVVYRGPDTRRTGLASDVRLTDLHPTICSILGVPVDDVPGSPVREIASPA